MIKTTIKIQCNCGEVLTVDLDEVKPDWEIVETDEREMGVERLYEAMFDMDCNNCDETITITLHVWEYPEGFCNMDEILVDGGELIEGCSLDVILFDEDEQD